MSIMGSIIKTATLLPLHTFTTIIIELFCGNLHHYSFRSLLLVHNQLRFCLFGHCWLNLINFRGMLNKIDKEIRCVSLKNAKLKWVQMQNINKIANLRCREICEPENREINVSRNSCNKVVLIVRAGGLYGRILTEVASTDRRQWGLYTRPIEVKILHTDRLSSAKTRTI